MWDGNFPREFFASGQVVPESGVYRVHHAEHRLSHEVTLIRENRFPICSKCANEVHFELLRAAPLMVDDLNFRFRIQLYALPVITDDDETKRDEAKAG